MKLLFSPGCALMLYKKELAYSVYNFLKENFNIDGMHHICCKHDPQIEEETRIINICPGCNKRFAADYEGCATISLWEMIDNCDSFKFPDYNGIEMTIIDACPTRDRTDIHKSIRNLLKKMNISLIEPERTGVHGSCCGDSFYGLIPVNEVKAFMKKRSDEMPRNNVAVYCISCIKSVDIGGKQPRYLVDLLFGEETLAGITDPDIWHKEIDDYISLH